MDATDMRRGQCLMDGDNKHRTAYNNNKTVLKKRKPPPTPKFQPKVTAGFQLIAKLIQIQIWMFAGSICFNAIRSIKKRCRRRCAEVHVSVSYSPSFVKAGGDCMRNANKSPRIPYSAMVRKMEK